MAADGVANHLAQLIHRVGLGENRMAQCARLESAFRCVVNREDNL
jgi:hypothetical protein